ncbi:UBA domain-containing protein 7 [Cladobotryum mycophilum]|uniref:UBA domain-containing protein 7 n=1 Tax=Cladobotryum mycophilum TaxID=491253 RepID=A0ABR0SPU2_9HYPO
MDDLSGLDWSSKPAGNQPKPPINSFSSFRASPMTSGQHTPLSAQGTSGSQSRTAPAKPSQDSFSNLMNFGLPKATQNLTLAERQAQLEAEKRRKEEEKRRQAEAQFGNGQQWDTLGSRGFTPSPAPPQPAPVNGAKNDDDDLFAAFNRDTKVDNASHYPPPQPEKKGLDLSDPTAWTAKTSSTTNGVFQVDDDDPFGLTELKPNVSAGTSRPVPAATDDFDFLGDLARPVDEIRREQEAKQQAARQASRHAPRAEPGKPIEDDSSSSDDDEPIERNLERVPRTNKDPFDKAVAQLVDYGFSPEQARRGLVESGSGFNAQAAANWLLDEAHRKAKETTQGKTSQGRNSPAVGDQSRNESRSPARGEVDLAKSAAAVGTSLFKSANSLWKTGQKKMQQAVSDFQQDGDPNQPKWMREAQQAQTQPRPRPTKADVTDEALMLESGGRVQKPMQSGSRQHSEPKVPRGQSPAPSSGPPSRNSPAPRWQQQPQPASISDARSRLDRLKVDDDDSFSISVSRRKKSSPAPEPKKSEPEPDLLFNTQAPKPSSPAPQQPFQRQSPAPTTHTPVGQDALQSSTKYRHQGTAHFKRGDYASAHVSYTASITSIPATHPLMILLLTNRALTALKTGEPKQAVTDADEALKIIGPGNGHGEMVAVRNESGQDENKDMKEFYGKALSRKAEALEQMEKWADAGTVWQSCVEAGVGGPTAIKGRQRCQEALTPKPKVVAKPVAKPRPPPSASLAPQKSSEAVTRLREANEAAAKEDDEKFALTDKVDAKVSAWRDGKRDNLRALISSLDNVLWENSGWKKVGLHELLQPNKVKISYMKAIAKTHPDKLPQDASTEVRLIAGLVFSTINESWDKFKAENGL